MVTDRTPTAPSGRLVHVGPHKTGTTTVQAAFHHNRRALLKAGVLYLGEQLQPATAVKALTGANRGALAQQGFQEWDRLLAKAQAHEGMVVLSSEFLCEADVAAARRVVDDLSRGSDQPPRVVVTLRPLAKILPSQWQQFVQSGSESPLEQWLEWVLKNVDSDPLPLVWRRHRHHDVVAHWVEAAGAENVTVVVTDDSQPRLLPQVFARLAGVPEEALVPPKPVANRSLTMEEAEAVRHFNVAFNALRSRHEQEPRKTPVPDLTMDQRMAAWRSVKRSTPDPSYHKVALPEPAAERVTALAQEIVAAITALGTDVVGDLQDLTRTPDLLRGEALKPEHVRPQLAAEVATALLAEVMTAPPARTPAPAPAPAPARIKTRAQTSKRFRWLSRRTA